MYFGMFIQFHTTMTKIPFELAIHLPAECLDEGSDVDFLFTFKGSTLRKIPFLLSLHQPQIFHEYCRHIFAMFTMPCQDLQHVNWPSLVVSSPPYRPVWAELGKRSFPDDVV